MNEELPVEELAERYRAGASLDDLAILCGCSPGKIRRILTAVRIEIRARGGVEQTPEAPHPAPSRTPPQRRSGRLSDQAAHDLLRTGELAGRYRAGASLEDLAIEYRCSPSKIRSLLFRAGVAIRPPGRKPATPSAAAMAEPPRRPCRPESWPRATGLVPHSSNWRSCAPAVRPLSAPS
jgi:uncharacterized protein (DUF433 family)